MTDVSGTTTAEGKRTHWISEAGALDIVMMPGPTAADVFRQYSDVTGKPELPPLFALGFHQCRWNYRDEPVRSDYRCHSLRGFVAHARRGACD